MWTVDSSVGHTNTRTALTVFNFQVFSASVCECFKHFVQKLTQGGVELFCSLVASKKINFQVKSLESFKIGVIHLTCKDNSAQIIKK